MRAMLLVCVSPTTIALSCLLFLFGLVSAGQVYSYQQPDYCSKCCTCSSQCGSWFASHDLDLATTRSLLVFATPAIDRAFQHRHHGGRMSRAVYMSEQLSIVAVIPGSKCGHPGYTIPASWFTCNNAQLLQHVHRSAHSSTMVPMLKGFGMTGMRIAHLCRTCLSS